jgi:hypothetical protein
MKGLGSSSAFAGRTPGRLAIIFLLTYGRSVKRSTSELCLRQTTRSEQTILGVIIRLQMSNMALAEADMCERLQDSGGIFEISCEIEHKSVSGA